jgi:hypothetical protein
MGLPLLVVRWSSAAKSLLKTDFADGTCAAFAWPSAEFVFAGIREPFFKFCSGLRDISFVIFPVTGLATLEAIEGPAGTGLTLGCTMHV